MVGLHEAKGDPLEKEKKSNTDDCALLPRNNLFSGWLRKGDRKFLSSYVLWRITQTQMDSMLFIMKAKKIEKNNIYTNISNLTLIKIIVHLVLNLKIFTSIISSFSGLVMAAKFGNRCNGCKV